MHQDESQDSAGDANGEETQSMPPDKPAGAEALGESLTNPAGLQSLADAIAKQAALGESLTNPAGLQSLADAFSRAARFGGSARPSLDDLEAGAPETLVSETALEETADEEIADIVGDDSTARPATLSAVVASLKAQGIESEIEGRGARFRLRFDLPAGRSTRQFSVSEESATVLADYDLSAWKSLQKYDGIWNRTDGTVEIVVREGRGMPWDAVRRRLGDIDAVVPASEEPGSAELILKSADHGVSVRIGEASPLAEALLADPLLRFRRTMTLRIENLAAATLANAEATTEQVTDSLAFEMDMRVGIMLIPQRLRTRLPGGARGRAVRRSTPSFPKGSYPHAPMLLYQAGRNLRTPPLIRFWSFYQVLEYFFPQYSLAEAVDQLSRHLRSPGFDAFRSEDILRAVQLAASAKGGRSEEEQLLILLKAIVSPQEVLDLIDEVGLSEQVQDRRSDLSEKYLRLVADDELIPQLARRIYDIRCRIVHSKSGSQRDAGPGLLPGTHHDELVRSELPLVEFLAQQSLIKVSEPLKLTPLRSTFEESDAS